MKKYILISALFIATTVGCTSPTQPYADKSLQLASQQYRTIVTDLAVMSKQSALDSAYAVITTEQDPTKRGEALIQMSDIYQKVSWLEVQAERSAGLLRNGREWVLSQKGIFNVLVEDWKKSSDNAELNKKVEVTTQETPVTN